MTVPFLDLPAQYKSIKPEVDAAIQEVIDTSAFALGPQVISFEKNFAAYCGVKHSVGLNSGTAALLLLLQAHGIGKGDEVITVANTFFATVEAMIPLGIKPVLVDCEESTGLVDITKIEAAITPKTKAIIPVHLYGQLADMDAIAKIAKPRGILVFEDACQAHGALYKGKRAGGLADGAAFSFYPGKNLGAYGDAGGVTTNDDAIAEKIRMLRDHGMPKKYHHAMVGWNERMDGIQGAVLDVKLKHLDEWNALRRKNADLYWEYLPDSVQTFDEIADGEGVYHLFVIRVPNRDAVQEKLKEKGIQTGIHYPVPLHLQEAVKDLGWKKGDFPVTEKLANEILSLPMYAELTEEQIKSVCSVLKEVL